MTDERGPEDAGDEPAELADWGAGWTAPPGLRAHTLEGARRRGLVKGRMMNNRGWWMGAALAAGVAFVAGVGIGTQRATSGTEIPVDTLPATRAASVEEAASPRYALFLFEDAAYQAPAANAMMERVKEYGGWAGDLAASGRFVTAEKLADDGSFVRLENGTLKARGPLKDAARGALTGYFVVGASSLEEAMDIARTCPHLKYGGSVEVRAIES